MGHKTWDLRADDKDEDEEGKKWQVLELWEADKEEHVLFKNFEFRFLGIGQRKHVLHLIQTMWYSIVAMKHISQPA